MASKIGKVVGIEMRLVNISLEMNNAPTSDTPLVTYFQLQHPGGSSLGSAPACHLYH